MQLDQAAGEAYQLLEKLAADTREAEAIEDLQKSAEYYEQTILKDMDELRAVVDAAEALIPEQYLPYPTYGSILFSLR
jgi:glutamine synthetase